MLILIGTNHKNKILIKLLKFIALCKSNTRSAQKPGMFFYNASYKKFNKTFKNEDSSAWLSKNIQNRNEYKNSPYPKFIITNRGFYDILSWIDIFTNKKLSKNININLPILLLNGDKDPVGNMGLEIKKAQKFYKKLNCNSKHIEYKGMRHEILNEMNNAIVYKDILNFIKMNL